MRGYKGVLFCFAMFFASLAMAEGRDEGVICRMRWYDEDGDGWGSGPTVTVCGPADGWAVRSGDCAPKSPFAWQVVGDLVMDADQDYLTVGDAGSRCVGSSQIDGPDPNGNVRGAWFRAEDGRYAWLVAEWAAGPDSDDARAFIP